MHFSPFKNERHLEIALIGIAVMLGALHAWVGRYMMNPDGISYLDMGDAFWRKDWAMALNTYWSPLYAILLGLGMRIVQPSVWAEFPLVHAINFLIYLAALFTFLFFLHELRGRYQGRAWLFFGYAFFLVAALNLITLALVSPDMIIAAFVFAISGVMVRLYKGDTRIANFVWFGILLGLAYLTKAIFFPLGFIFLGAAAFFGTSFKTMAPRILLSLLLFLSVASAWALPLSFAKNRFTFGDAGKLTYAWHVNGITRQIHWQGGDDRFGIPLHPTRKIFDNPIVYEFAHPIGGTYPPWYDPSYWYDGLKTSFSAKAQMKAIFLNSRLFYEMLMFYQIGSVIVGMSIAFALLFWRRFREGMRALGAAWPLLLPSFTATGLYLLIIVQPRYIAPFLVVLLMIVWWRLTAFASSDTRQRLSLVAGVLALFLFLPVSIASIEKAITPASKKHQQIAVFLQEKGLRASDNVAVIGDYFHAWEAFWARLVRAAIIAEMPPDASNVINFWTNQDTQSTVLTLLKAKGARMVIAGDPIAGARLDRWQPIEGTSAYVLFFPESSQNQMRQEGK